jgi:acyl-CoA synthetase (NDP forming)
VRTEEREGDPLGERRVLREDEAKSILREHGIAVPDFFVIEKDGSPTQHDVRYPLVAKVSSDKIVHKTDVGGVVKDIKDRKQLLETLAELRKRFPDEGILLEPMERGDVELILGIVHDSVFGPTIMLGLGGVQAELYKDVTFRTIPIDGYDAEEMMSELKGSKILEGFRGIKVNRAAIKELLLKVSRMGEEMGEDLEQLDLNPVLANENGVIAVDAKMILRT